MTGTYSLSWEGTAQGKIGAGSYGNSGITGSVTGGTNLNIEFGTGTLRLVQLEKGSVATPFEYRPYDKELGSCKRYGAMIIASNYVGNTANNFFEGVGVNFETEMRATPTIGVIQYIQNSSILTNPYSEQPTVYGFRSMAQASGPNCAWVTKYFASAEL